MTHWFDQILAYSGTHPHLLALVVFVSATAEAIIVVGAIFPGTGIILAASGIAGAANLSLWPLVLWAAGGAALGDGVSYWIGHHYGRSLSRHWPFSARPQIFERGESFFARHGGKSVFLGRFVPGVKAVIPAIAGMVGMSAPRFLAANLSSGILWAAGHVLPAAAAGVLLATVGSVSNRLLGALAAALVAAVLAYWLARILVVKASPLVTTGYRVALERLSHSRSSLIRRIARAGDPGNPEFLGAIAWSAMLVLALIGFAGVVQDIISADPLTRADAAISQLVQSMRTAPLDRVMILITEFGDGVVMAVAAGALLIALVAAKRWRSVVVVGSAFAMAAATVQLIKLVLHRQRPIEIYSGADLFSFPSGHSTFTTLFFATLALLISSRLGPRGRIVVWTAALFGVMAIGLSRIYLGAHWPSDVMGGVLFGFVICSLLALLLRHKTHLGRAGFWTGASAGVVFLGFGAVHAHLNVASDTARYAPVSKPVVIEKTTWLASGWAQLPRQRIDLFGETEEPLSFQYVGRLGPLTDTLQAAGWHRAEIDGWADFLRLLSPVTKLNSLSPWPLLHDGRWPALMLTKMANASSRRLVLRLWTSKFTVATKAENERLLVGSVTEEAVTHPYSALTVMRDEPAPLTAVHEIYRHLSQNSAISGLGRSWPSGADVFLVSVPRDSGTAPEAEAK